MNRFANVLTLLLVSVLATNVCNAQGYSTEQENAILALFFQQLYEGRGFAVVSPTTTVDELSRITDPALNLRRPIYRGQQA